MDWLLITPAVLLVAGAVWLWRSIQPRVINLEHMPAWLRQRAQLPSSTESGLESAMPSAPAPSPAPSRVPQPPLPSEPSAPRPRQPTMVADRAPSPEGWLVLRSGSRSGPQFGLHRGRSTVGRDSSQADIVLEDETVSGEHARIQFEQGRFYIYNMSTTGTYVKNRDVGRVQLFDGDRIRVGQTILVFEAIDGEARARIAGSAGPGGIPREPSQHEVVVKGELPTKMYERDSCVLWLQLLPGERHSPASQDDSRVICFSSDHVAPRVQVELQAVGFEVAGKPVQSRSWDGEQPLQCVWSIRPRSGGSFELGLVFRAQSSKGMEQVDALVCPVSVRNYAGLSKRQVQFMAGVLSTLGTLLGVAEVLHRLGAF